MKASKGKARPFLSTPVGLSLVIFLSIFLPLIHHCRHTYFRDPTSAFFDPVRGYERSYSLEREQQALVEVVESANNYDGFVSSPVRDDVGVLRMCIGIATVAREGEQYVQRTVGSLLAGLNDTQRSEIRLLTLIAHTTPEVHPAFDEPWLRVLSDEVLLYDDRNPYFNQLNKWEADRNFLAKGRFDYAFTLTRCFDSGAPYVAIIEDDTLAAEDWYQRTFDALYQVENYHHRHLATSTGWLYLRLFFTEEFLGWNIEEWPAFLAQAIAIEVMTALVLYLLHQWLPRYIPHSVIVAVTGIYIPSLIILYLAAGRLSMQPLNPGVVQMPNYGCCAQGLVFPRQIVPEVIERLGSANGGFVDQTLEQWAAEGDGLARWAVVPSLLQHIGAHSSKGDDFGVKAEWGRSVAQKIWSFGFESYGQGRSQAQNID